MTNKYYLWRINIILIVISFYTALNYVPYSLIYIHISLRTNGIPSTHETLKIKYLQELFNVNGQMRKDHEPICQKFVKFKALFDEVY